MSTKNTHAGTAISIAIVLIQVAAFGFVLYFVYRNFDLESFKRSLIDAQKGYILAGVLLIYLNEFIYGLRWHIASRTFNIAISLGFFMRGAFIVRFLDYLLPLPAADDVYKVLLLKMKSIRLSKGIASSLFDNVIGFLFLVLILPFSLEHLLHKSLLTNHEYSLYLLPALILSVVAISLLIKPILIFRLMEFSVRFLPFKGRLKIDGEQMLLKYNYRRIGQLLLLTMVNYLILVIILILLFNAFESHVRTGLILLMIPLFTFSRILPISYQGFGLYEASIVFFLGYLTDLPRETLYSVSVVHLGLSLLIYLSGGLLLYKSSIRKELLVAVRKRKFLQNDEELP